MWCLVFGVGSLIWGQIVVSIPTKFVKSILCMKQKSGEETIDTVDALPEIHISQHDEHEELSRSKVLWIHGIRRIMYQVIGIF